MRDSKIVILEFLVLIILLSVGYFGFPDDTDTRGVFYKLAGGLAIAVFIHIVGWIIQNWKLLWYWMRINLPWSFYKPIRVTVAYLFRIEVDGQYLLVKNQRKIPGYQPPGGVYKYLRRENADLFDELGLIPDNKIPRDLIIENDLRLHMKSRRKLLRFIRWFDKKKWREVDPWREFYEELVKSEILSHKNFPHIQYRYVKQHSEIKFSIHHQILEYKIADIYELLFSSEAQKNELRGLLSSSSREFIFATAEEINNMQKGQNSITEHTYKII